MSGRRRHLPSPRAGTGQESTPNIGKTTDGESALSSLDYDVMSTPRKKGQKRKHPMEEDRSIEGSAGKAACLSLENSCVRRTLSIVLSGLKAEPENPEESEPENPEESEPENPEESEPENPEKGEPENPEESDQKSPANKSKARNKAPLHWTPAHGVLAISSRNAPVGSLRQDKSEKTCDAPPEMSRGNKRLVVELERLKDKSGNLEETVHKKSNSENGLDQESESGISAPGTHSSSSNAGVRRSLRKKNLQFDTLEEERFFMETDDEAQKQSTEESESEEELDQELMELSAYELERLKNIKENAKFLNSIKLLESAASLQPPKKKNQNRVVRREKPQNAGSTMVRRSMRLQNAAPSPVNLVEDSPAVEEHMRHSVSNKTLFPWMYHSIRLCKGRIFGTTKKAALFKIIYL